MRVVLQRVSHASVEVDGRIVAKIWKGLIIYLGAATGDTFWDASYIADKIVNMRIFEDDKGKMNLSIADVRGQILLVSNFTLCGNCRKGRRPGFDTAADPESANALFEEVVKLFAASDISVEKGVFGAHMHVTSINDGPVTFTLDSRGQ